MTYEWVARWRGKDGVYVEVTQDMESAKWTWTAFKQVYGAPDKELARSKRPVYEISAAMTQAVKWYAANYGEADEVKD